MTVSFGLRPTYAKVNLNDLIFNFNSVKNFINEDISYMAVVKANAYGHGAVECAKTFQKADVDCLGVALPKKALN
jgi:alanine racemase